MPSPTAVENSASRASTPALYAVASVTLPAATCRATSWSMTSSRVEALASMATASGLSRSVILTSNPFPY